MKYRTASPFFKEEDIDHVLRETRRILSGEGLLSMGKNVDEFENLFSKYTGTKGAVATNSCTSALEIALMSIGISHGDEVIIPVQTFIATGSAVLRVGGVPVFCDVNHNYLLDFKSLKDAITKSTKAVILVHFSGLLHEEINEIKNYLEERNIYLIEDAAHAPGASINNKKAGTFGDLSCFSFFSTKNMTTGEGGMITSDNSDLLKKCSSIRNRGIDTDNEFESFIRLGGNYRMTEFQALLGKVQLNRLDEINHKRNEIANIYIKNLNSCFEKGLIEYPIVKDGIYHSYWRFWIRLKEGIDRKCIKDSLKNESISSDWAYDPLLHLQPLFKDNSNKSNSFSKSEELASRHICIPIHTQIEKEDAEFISSTLSKILIKKYNEN
jgi:perosamine synthetase